MSENNKILPAPSREEVEAKLIDLTEGRLSREEITLWAAQWVMQDDPDVDDLKVWNALVTLSGTDLISTDRPYLYGEEDFQIWLDDFRAT